MSTSPAATPPTSPPTTPATPSAPSPSSSPPTAPATPSAPAPSSSPPVTTPATPSAPAPSSSPPVTTPATPSAPAPSSPPPTAPVTPSAPPSTNQSALPPSTTPSALPPATPSAPPSVTPSTPPPAVPSAPPPAVPSAPPPTTPSAPPPAVPTSSPPPAVPSLPPSTSTPTPPTPTPPTPSRPLPPPTTPGGGGTPSPPETRTPPAFPPPRTPPPSKTTTPSSSSSSSSISTPVFIGIAAAAAAVLLLLAGVCLCCLKRRKRRDIPLPPSRLASGVYPTAAVPQPPPPPPPSWAKQKDDFGEQPQTWHQNVPPPRNHAISLPPPNMLPAYASQPPLASPPVFSSGGSVSNHSVSESPTPGLILSFSKSTFTFEELEQATSGFSDANLLGKGGFGYVHKGILPNGQEVAIKQLKTGSGQGDREFHAEVEIISRVHHKHLVSLVGYCTTGDRRLLVYEFVPNNTLDFHLHGKETPTIDWPARLKIAWGSAKGLAYLHEDCHPKIIHRDIKASNILLDFRFEAKVSDFGLAKLTSDNNTHVSTRVMGTFGYLAPEYASSGKLTEKSDVFSFGVMLLELITGQRPVDTTNAFMDDSLVEWARPLLGRALEDGNFEMLADQRLQNYNVKEMARMVACAAACINYSARRRPRMSQVVRVLEGDSSLEILSEGLVPGHSPKYSSYSSSEYDVGKYNEDMKRFRKLALSSQEYGSSDYPTSEYGQNPSASSSEAVTREIDMEKINNDGDELR